MKLSDHAKSFLACLNVHGIAHRVKIRGGGQSWTEWWIGYESMRRVDRAVRCLVVAGYALRLANYGPMTVGISRRGRTLAEFLRTVEVGEIRPRLRGGKY